MLNQVSCDERDSRTRGLHNCRAKASACLLALALTGGLGNGVRVEAYASQDQTDELKKKLIRETTGQAEEDLMSRIINLMGQTARRLQIEFRPDAQTQSMQEQILKDLDDAIKLAAQNTRKQSASASSGAADRRSAPPKSAQKTAEADSGKQDGQAATDASRDETSASSLGESGRVDRSVELRERRRGWGNLPARDRDEVIEGLDEAVMPRFRDWIERYYRTLQGVEGQEE